MEFDKNIFLIKEDTKNLAKAFNKFTLDGQHFFIIGKELPLYINNIKYANVTIGSYNIKLLNNGKIITEVTTAAVKLHKVNCFICSKDLSFNNNAVKVNGLCLCEKCYRKANIAGNVAERISA